MKKAISKLQQWFVTGLLVSLPAFVTILILVFVFNKLDSFLGVLIQPWLSLPGGKRIPGLGLLALIIIIFLTGMVTRFYIGRKLFGLTDKIFTAVPLTKSIYLATSQIRDFIKDRKQILFRDVVLVHFPTEESYSIGFTTQRISIALKKDDPRVPVFLPTTPNPTSGFLIFLPRDEIVKLDISPEEAVKLIISGGLVVPDKLEQHKLNDNTVE